MKKEFTIDDSIEALIFDLDGTVVDTMPAHFQAWQQTAAKLGFEFSHDEFYELAGLPATEIAVILNGRRGYSLNPQEVEDTKAGMFVEDMDKVQLIDFTMDIIKANYGKRPMIIGTGNLKSVAQKTLKAMNIEHYFNGIVSCNDVENYKPHPETFKKCADILGIKYENCIVFEDGDKGIEAAKAANMHVVDVKKYI